VLRVVEKYHLPRIGSGKLLRQRRADAPARARNEDVSAAIHRILSNTRRRDYKDHPRDLYLPVRRCMRNRKWDESW
jgi:hypothetical protein